jgi:hypothetical protein
MHEALFQTKESLSPKEAWMRRFRILTVHSNPGDLTKDGRKIKEENQWLAVRPNPQAPLETMRGEGATEHEALAVLALRMGVPMWNEEGYIAFGPVVQPDPRPQELQALMPFGLEGSAA